MSDIGEKHISVLLDELINNIEIKQKKENIIVDCTLGMGGHFLGVAKKMKKGDIIIGFDADIASLELAKKRILNELEENDIENGIIEKIEEKKEDILNIILVNNNFENIKEELESRGINKISGIYYDLGLSSLHLDEADRGFSFMNEGPLDMRLDKSKGQRASTIVNGYTSQELRKILLEFGEEPGANKIAHLIVEERKKKKFETTKQLADIIPGPIKVKARVFQAIRIETNNELENLEKSLNDGIKLLEKDGIIFVISFHSLEDRITKQILKRETKECICSDLICSCNHKKTIKLINKKPIIPTKEEILLNSRSRSAKARIGKKL